MALFKQNRLLISASTFALLLASSATADRPSYNMYGMTGLIDMPSAFMQEDGRVGITGAYMDPSMRATGTFQVLPWMEISVRYGGVRDWYRRANGDHESTYDRSADIKFRLLKEGRFRPAIAVGLQDTIGTGLFSSEYIVASKHITEDISATVGVGWGRMATQGSFKNPFYDISDHFKERDEEIGQGGTLNNGNWFAGNDAAVFGGIEWNTPIDGLRFKAEYSSDAYNREEQKDIFDHKSPINFGVEYRPIDSVELGVYYMYGSTIGARLTFTGNPKTPELVSKVGTGPAQFNPRPTNADRNVAWTQSAENRDLLSKELAKALKAEGISLHKTRIEGSTIEIQVVNNRYMRKPQAIGRAARLMASALPAGIETFKITPIEEGIPISTAIIKRSDMENQVNRPQAGEKSWATTKIEDGNTLKDEYSWLNEDYQKFNWSINPSIPINLFDNEDRFEFRGELNLNASYHFTRSLSLNGKISQLVFGDNSPDNDQSTSPIKHVRSDGTFYRAADGPVVENLTLDYYFKPADNLYGHLTGGYLERQYVGVGAELLYKKPSSRLAFGLDLNYVRQRDYEGLGLLEVSDYKGIPPDGFTADDVVNDEWNFTGFASAYWDTGWHGIDLQLDVGQYLAQDWGATISVAREFANGWKIGGYVTKTDITADEFGEGSYDKGVSLTIPIGWFTPYDTPTTVTVSKRSLSRDGGAKLRKSETLYPKVKGYDRGNLEENWGSLWQ